MGLGRRVAMWSLVLATCAAPSWAQAPEPEPEVFTDPLREEVRSLRVDQDGWYLDGSVGGNFSFQHNSNFVGAIDGIALQIGVMLGGRAQLHQGNHDWVTEARIQTTFSKLPNIDSFLKTADVFDFRTTYSWRIPGAEWLGPFARASFNTQIFPGYAIQPMDTNVTENLADGSTRSRLVRAQDAISLNTYFEPFQLRQLLGMFADAVDEDSLKLTFELGIGAQQVFTADGFVVSDQGTAGELQLTQLRDFQQVGAEIGMNLTAQVQENLSWTLRANALQPFYSSLNGVNGIHSMNVEVSSKLSLRLTSWASLDYVLEVRRVPLILEEWQIQNGLLLTAGFDVARRPPGVDAPAE